MNLEVKKIKKLLFLLISQPLSLGYLRMCIHYVGMIWIGGGMVPTSYSFGNLFIWDSSVKSYSVDCLRIQFLLILVCSFARVKVG